VLKISHNNETLPFCYEPTYFGGMLGRTLSHFEKGDIMHRAPEVACLGAGATTLRTATLALFHSTAE